MTVKLKKYQVVALYQALAALDKADSQDAKDRVIESPYKFKAAAVYALSKNLRKTKAAVLDIERIREQMFNTHKEKPEDKELAGDRMKAFVKEYNEFIESDTDLELHTVKLSDLDLDNNPVPLKIMSELVDTVIVES